MEKELKPTFHTNQIALATNCLYRGYSALRHSEHRPPADTDGIRGDLALELFAKTTRSGIQIVVCDGGSSPDFLSAVKGFQNQGLTLVNSDSPGRGPQRRKAFEVAASLPDAKIILYSQPEKDPGEVISITDYIKMISEPILDGSTDIVIPRRNPDLGRQSYPPYMWKSELRVNKTYDWLMRRARLMTKKQSFDWFFGQLAFKNDPGIVSLFLKQYELKGPIRSRINAQPNPEAHSDGHYFPLIEALFRNLPVTSVEVPFVYPPAQRANEMSPEKIADFKKRRALDGAAYRLEAIHLLAYLNRDPKSQIRKARAA